MPGGVHDSGVHKHLNAHLLGPVIYCVIENYVVMSYNGPNKMNLNLNLNQAFYEQEALFLRLALMVKSCKGFWKIDVNFTSNIRLSA